MQGIAKCKTANHMLAILKALIRKGYKMKSQNRKVSREIYKSWISRENTTHLN